MMQKTDKEKEATMAKVIGAIFIIGILLIRTFKGV